MNRHDNKKRILVVDDDPQSAENVARELLRDGWRVALARDAAETLDRLAAEPFDALLSNALTSNLNGFELLRHVRAEHPRLPVVLMTRWVGDELDDEMILWARVWCAVALLRKPVTGEDLTAALSRVAHSNHTEAQHELQNDRCHYSRA